MLTYEEFTDKKTVILNKNLEVIIFNKSEGRWLIYVISKSSYGHGVFFVDLFDEKAYEYYKEKMASYGFRQFEILTE